MKSPELDPFLMAQLSHELCKDCKVSICMYILANGMFISTELNVLLKISFAKITLIQISLTQCL